MLSFPDFQEKQVVICFAQNDHKINFQNDNLIIRNEKDEVILQNSCYKIFALWVIGSTTLTSGIMERSKKFGFGIHLFSYTFRQYGVWNAPTEGNFLLRTKQYHNLNEIAISQKIIENKIGNQLTQLKSIRNKNPFQKECIQNLVKYSSEISGKTKIQEIMGLEGISSKLYFEAWFYDLNWLGRKPRAKRDILNVLMDIGYTFLFNMVESMLLLYGFDIYKGVLHQNFYQRKSLVCDIVEPFRCIVDHQIKNAWNLGQIKTEDFKIEKGQYILQYKNSKAYTKWLLTAIIDNKKPIFLYVQAYYRWFMKEKSMNDFPQFTF